MKNNSENHNPENPQFNHYDNNYPNSYGMPPHPPHMMLENDSNRNIIDTKEVYAKMTKDFFQAINEGRFADALSISIMIPELRQKEFFNENDYPPYHWEFNHSLNRIKGKYDQI